MVKQRTSIDDIFHAMADAKRRTIVSKLLLGERTMTELARPLNISLPGAMKHLAILQDNGIVIRRKEGRTVFYRLDPRPLKKIKDLIARYEEFWLSQLGDLEKRLKSHKR